MKDKAMVIAAAALLLAVWKFNKLAVTVSDGINSVTVEGDVHTAV